MIRFIMLCLFAVLVAPFAQAADDLCPEVDQAKYATPNSVVGVQSDIDRLNLCVERAKLLKQLDELAKTRADILAKVTDPMSSFSGGTNMTGLGIAPLPTSALPQLPVNNMSSIQADPSGKVKITPADGSPLSGTVSTPAAEGPATWKVRKIWGQAGGVSGATMRAQLSDGRGTLLNVVKGDPLPDGQVVESVSIKGVALSQNSKIIDLSWDDMSDASSASSSSAAPASTMGKNDNKTTP